MNNDEIAKAAAELRDKAEVYLKAVDGGCSVCGRPDKATFIVNHGYSIWQPWPHKPVSIDDWRCYHAPTKEQQIVKIKAKIRELRMQLKTLKGDK